MDKQHRLKDQWVLITGATAGIGKATAHYFAKEKANLVLTGRRGQRLRELKDELVELFNVHVEVFEFDVRDREECRKCINSVVYPIDILVNNAGLASGKDAIDNADFEDWDKMIDTNVKGLLNMTRFVSERMKKRNSGHIINISSIAGHEAYPGGSVYCATKHAVDAITKATKMDLHGTGIRVSAVSPGLVETEFSEVRFHGDKEKAKQVYENTKALTADDIAEIIIFMATRPSHVNIMDTIVLPISQSSSTMVHRSET